MSAMPIGMPGWPDLACSTASIASARNAFAMRRKGGWRGGGSGARAVFMGHQSSAPCVIHKRRARPAVPDCRDRADCVMPGASINFAPARPSGMGRAQMAIEVGTGDYRYRIIENWAKLPDGWSFKEVAAVGCDKNDNVYAFGRGEHPMMEFDRTGKFHRSRA